MYDDPFVGELMAAFGAAIMLLASVLLIAFG